MARRIEPGDIESTNPLSPVQSGILFHVLADSSPDLYLSQSIIHLNGPIDELLLREAWQRALERFSALRSIVVWEGLDEPLQIILRSIELSWKVSLEIDKNLSESDRKSELGRILAADRLVPIGLNRAPVFRLQLLRIESDSWILLWTFHHIILDGWSSRLVLHDVLEEYGASTRGEIRKAPDGGGIQAAQERRRREISAAEKTRWRSHLSSLISTYSLTELGFSAASKGVERFRLEREVEADAWERLQSLVRRRGVTLSAVICSAWALLLRRLLGENSVMFGVTLSGRDPETMGAVGCLVDTLPMVVRFTEELEIGGLLVSVREEIQELQGFSVVSLAKIAEWAEREKGKPLFDTLVVVETMPERASNFLDGTGVSLERVEVDEYSHYGTALVVEPTATRLKVYLIADGKAYSPEFGQQILRCLEIILYALVEDSSENLRDFDSVTSKGIAFLRRDQRPDSVDDSTTLPPGNVVTWIAGQIESRSKDVALVLGEQMVSYQELWSWSGHLAKSIRDRGVDRGQRVGLFGGRTIKAIIGILGILRAGAAYVPLDRSYPIGRIEEMIQDASLSLLLCDGKLTEMPEVDCACWEIPDSGDIAVFDEPVLTSEDPAYLIYTSGSTGKPKGVALNHGNLLWTTAARQSFYKGDPSVVFLLLSPLSFDSSIPGIFWSLAVGGRLVLMPDGDEKNPRSIATLLDRYLVTHTLCLPALWELLLDAIGDLGLKSLREVAVAGEVCSPSVVERHFSQLPWVKLVNEYGPTEAAVWSLARRMDQDREEKRIPIGTAVPGATVLLLDPNGLPVPVGVQGELFIGGPGVAIGYWNRDAETADRFVRLTDESGDSRRFYRAGDLAYRNGADELVFIGRSDRQVKVRGYRVELGEIESVICKHSEVREAFVLQATSGGGESNRSRLRGFVSVRDSAVQDEQISNEIRALCLEQLPSYMVPVEIVILDEFPRLSNGKIDGLVLSEVGFGDRPISQPEGRAELSENESILAQAWKDLLGIDFVQPGDTFYELGGDSLLCIRIASKARELGFDLSPGDFDGEMTLAELAAQGKAKFGETESGPSEAEGDGGLLLTPIQKWFFEQAFADSKHWNQTLVLWLSEDACSETWLGAIHELCSVHAVFRSRFFQRNGQWACDCVPKGQVEVLRHTLKVLEESDVKSEIRRCLESQQLTLGDDGKAWCRMVLFEGSDHRPLAVAVVAHHLLVDLISWRVVAEDLLSGAAGRSIPLPQTSVSTWSSYLDERVRKGGFTDEKEFWSEANRIPSAAIPRDFTASDQLNEEKRRFLSQSWSSEDVTALMAIVENRWRARLDEVLIAVLAATLNEWLGGEGICIGLEHHGRASFIGGHDIGRTVGWLTTFYPISVPRATIDETVRSVKKTLRSVPHSGIGYGALRYLSSDPGTRAAAAQLGNPDVTFNFVNDLEADLNSLERDGGESMEIELVQSRSPKNTMSHMFEIEAMRKRDRLMVKWYYNELAHKSETIRLLMDLFSHTIDTVLASKETSSSVALRPEDLEDTDIDQADLDALLGET